jgi:hypothetical protein
MKEKMRGIKETARDFVDQKAVAEKVKEQRVRLDKASARFNVCCLLENFVS